MADRNNVVKDSEILGNGCREDCFGYAIYATEIYQKLKSRPKNSLIALVGNSGVGKTFLVKMMEENNSKKAPAHEHWLYFDVNQHLEVADIWDTFRVKLTRVIRLNPLEMFRFNVFFIVEVIRSLFFRTKKNALTSTLAWAIWILGLLAIFIVASYLVAMLFAFVMIAILLGLLPFRWAIGVFRFLNEKMAPSDEDRFRDLALRIRASKKNIFVVIDNMYHFGKQETLFLQKVRRLLKRNRSDRDIRIVVPLSPQTLALCSRNHCLGCMDYVEPFQPELVTNKLIERIFSKQFIKRVTLARCKKLIDVILETTDQNLHILKLIIRTAEHTNKGAENPEELAMQSLEHTTKAVLKRSDNLIAFPKTTKVQD